MNNLILKASVFLIIFTGTLVSCGDDDNSNNDTTPNQTSADQTTAIAQTGTWRITYFFDSDTDETSDFAGINFTFNADGSVNAAGNGQLQNGTWSISDNSSNSSNDDDGNSTSDDDFNLFFPVPDSSIFEDLNDDWDFVSVSETKIALTDVSGGNGGTDFLTFEKN
ncbi:MAG: hypothetical protein ACSHW7_09695 [Patiriisocius sp.]|uniref:hypothetical protein n=1 Tax=Patiriisocius sp. TaxID=2822396 RepID=UPI003EF566F0